MTKEVFQFEIGEVFFINNQPIEVQYHQGRFELYSPGHMESGKQKLNFDTFKGFVEIVPNQDPTANKISVQIHNVLHLREGEYTPRPERLKDYTDKAPLKIQFKLLLQDYYWLHPNDRQNRKNLTAKLDAVANDLVRKRIIHPEFVKDAFTLVANKHTHRAITLTEQMLHNEWRPS